MKHPPILITTNREVLFAYLLQVDGRAVVIEHVDFQHDGQTGVALIDWSHAHSCYVKLAECITAILDRYQPESWTLVAPEGLTNRLLPNFPDHHTSHLTSVRTMDVDDVTISNVSRLFQQRDDRADVPP